MMIICIFILVAINISILISCGKQQQDTTNLQNKTLKEKNNNKNNNNASKSTIEARDLYHELAARNLAFPATSRCRNHDDVWRMLALYLDLIRTVNPDDFVRFELLDSGMAVLHDIQQFLKIDQATFTNESIALGIVYFLVNYNRINVNLGDQTTPWYTIINRRVKLEDLQSICQQIEKGLIGGNEKFPISLVHKSPFTFSEDTLLQNQKTRKI